jgi:DNA-binding CsgD family transcriptional regulator
MNNASGLRTDEAATLQNVRISTVKSQPNSVFAKPGVNRQADRVKLLLTGPFRASFCIIHQ